METPFDLSSIGVTADGDGAPSPDAATGSTSSSPAEASVDKRSPQAREMDDHVKAALRKNIVNHELACIVVDLVSPGHAVERLGGVGLENLSPTQHLLVACSAVTATVFITNPALYTKLKSSLKAKADGKQLPAGQQRLPIEQPASPRVQGTGAIDATEVQGRAAPPRSSVPAVELRDMTGNPL